MFTYHSQIIAISKVKRSCIIKKKKIVILFNTLKFLFYYANMFK